MSKLLGYVKLATPILSIAFVFGCGLGYIPNDKGGSSSGSLGFGGVDILDLNEGENALTIQPNEKTSTFIEFEKALASYESVLDVTATAAIHTRFNDLISPILSDNGNVFSLNFAVTHGLTALAGDFCVLSWNYELTLPRAQRRFFPLLNATTGLAASNWSSPGIAEDTIRRLARAAWGRNESPIELEIIKDALAELIAANANTTTQAAYVYMCTMTLASLSGIEL